MSKDKKTKDEDLDLASLEGMVRLQAILRRYGVSPHIADLVTEALEKMVSEAISEMVKQIRETSAESQKTVIWAATIIGLLITVFGVLDILRG